VVWYVGLKSVVFWDTTSCGLVWRFEEYGVLGYNICGLACRFEEYGVLGYDIMWFAM
jgi:hypothetical protein